MRRVTTGLSEGVNLRQPERNARPIPLPFMTIPVSFEHREIPACRDTRQSTSPELRVREAREQGQCAVSNSAGSTQRQVGLFSGGAFRCVSDWEYWLNGNPSNPRLHTSTGRHVTTSEGIGSGL